MIYYKYKQIFKLQNEFSIPQPKIRIDIQDLQTAVDNPVAKSISTLLSALVIPVQIK